MIKSINVIKCERMDLQPKDMIELCNKKQFLFLLGDGCVFEFKGYYYIISNEVVYYTKIWEFDGEI